jgi:hypothetical protein
MVKLYLDVPIKHRDNLPFHCSTWYNWIYWLLCLNLCTTKIPTVSGLSWYDRQSLSPGGMHSSRQVAYLPATRCHYRWPPRPWGTGWGSTCVWNSCPSPAAGGKTPRRQRDTPLLGPAVMSQITQPQVTQLKRLCGNWSVEKSNDVSEVGVASWLHGLCLAPLSG